MNSDHDTMHYYNTIDQLRNRNFQYDLEKNDGFFRKIDHGMFGKSAEVERELTNIYPTFSNHVNKDKVVEPNCYKTMREPETSSGPTEDIISKPEPVKVRKRFSNYLKDQYRNLADETMGKSYMMMQDLKEVLQKRGISN
ncbi:uncharacterized protein CDAR_574201 [Caerostris darwini]|uniref:Uncharacterized protein n=1 Tax=Caerostris darwini TaxID=1538125 RepID=A0AAV4R6L0_9ARAC|nr:uncharacterized protein CDAR_574201 [Caerostris darwini]